MSIASEISRLQTAKADLKTAIEGKGVTVPAAATLDDYAQLVSSISGGGGSSVFDNMLEVVDSFTPNAVAESIDFDCDGSEGAYIVVSDPPGNTTNAAQQEYGDQIMNMVFFGITGKSSKSIRGPYTMTTRKAGTSSTDMDYWTPTITVSTNVVTVKLTNNGVKKFVPGFTYYLCKVKGM